MIKKVLRSMSNDELNKWLERDADPYIKNVVKKEIERRNGKRKISYQ